MKKKQFGNKETKKHENCLPVLLAFSDSVGLLRSRGDAPRRTTCQGSTSGIGALPKTGSGIRYRRTSIDNRGAVGVLQLRSAHEQRGLISAKRNTIGADNTAAIALQTEIGACREAYRR